MTGRGVEISPVRYEEIIAHCQREWPKEACGILAGVRPPRLIPPGGPGQLLVESRRVIRVYPMRNVEGSPIGYRMDPKEQLHVERDMRHNNQQMLGIYHSHTASDAYPSSVDVRLAISPDISYVLISLKDQARPVLKSYTIDGTRVEDEHVWIGGL